MAGSYPVSAKKWRFEGNNLQEMPQRISGKTGEKLSVIGLGGMVLKGMEAKQADKIVGQSIDRGVNYFDQDILWTQGFGYAEKEKNIKAGPSTIYSICSIHARSRS